ncbi:MAG TPA: hypothetical protein PK941_03950, partial [Paludibacter sp.]|nr:hypothetical protein [Paludibacter sp.]
MKNFIACGIFFLLSLSLSNSSCSDPDNDLDNLVEEPIAIPEGDVQVAVYYFPNWGPVSSSEWRIVKAAKPQFEGHQQPKVPVW